MSKVSHPYLSLATSHRHVDKSSGVCESLLRASLRSLLLFLGFDLDEDCVSLDSCDGFQPAGEEEACCGLGLLLTLGV